MSIRPTHYYWTCSSCKETKQMLKGLPAPRLCFSCSTAKKPNMNFEDNVNHPSHYTPGQIEAIDYIKDNLTEDKYIGFCVGNVLKYVSRYELKNGVEDLEKAATYLKWAIEVLKDGKNNA